MFSVSIAEIELGKRNRPGTREGWRGSATIIRPASSDHEVLCLRLDKARGARYHNVRCVISPPDGRRLESKHSQGPTSFEVHYFPRDFYAPDAPEAGQWPPQPGQYVFEWIDY